MADVAANITTRRHGYIYVNGKCRDVPRTSAKAEQCIIAAFKARGLITALRNTPARLRKHLGIEGASYD